MQDRILACLKTGNIKAVLTPGRFADDVSVTWVGTDVTVEYRAVLIGAALRDEQVTVSKRQAWVDRGEIFDPNTPAGAERNGQPWIRGRAERFVRSLFETKATKTKGDQADLADPHP